MECLNQINLEDEKMYLKSFFLSFERGQVQMRCVGQVLEDDEAPLFKCVEAYLLRLLQKEATVFCGVFAVPYLRVPENLHLVSPLFFPSHFHFFFIPFDFMI